MTTERLVEQWWVCGLPEDGWQVRTRITPFTDEGGWTYIAAHVELVSPDRQTILPVHHDYVGASVPAAIRHTRLGLHEAEDNAIRIARLLATPRSLSPRLHEAETENGASR